MIAPGQHVAVVGGGVIGALCAWSLTERGLRVTIIDRDGFGAACSHGNCGYVCPSHVLPLCQPGAITTTMRAMLKRNSPFAIKPRLSRRWAAWFWNFAKRCNERDMLATAQSVHGLLQSSIELYRAMVAAGIECEWQERGLIFVYDVVLTTVAFFAALGLRQSLATWHSEGLLPEFLVPLGATPINIPDYYPMLWGLWPLWIVALYFGDQLVIDPTREPVVTVKLKLDTDVTGAGGALGASDTLFFGLAAARNNDRDSITEQALFVFDRALDAVEL